MIIAGKERFEEILLKQHIKLTFQISNITILTLSYANFENKNNITIIETCERSEL